MVRVTTSKTAIAKTKWRPSADFGNNPPLYKWEQNMVHRLGPLTVQYELQESFVNPNHRQTNGVVFLIFFTRANPQNTTYSVILFLFLTTYLSIFLSLEFFTIVLSCCQTHQSNQLQVWLALLWHLIKCSTPSPFLKFDQKL